MGKKRFIFYGIFSAYQLLAFIFTIVIDADASVLFSMARYVYTFKYLSFIGVVLIITDFVWAWRHSKRVRDEAHESSVENNTLKAKIYDFQETKKQVAPTGSK